MQTVILELVFIALYAYCSPTQAQTSALSNKQKRHETMQRIAKDSCMANEMINEMINSKNGRQNWYYVAPAI